MLNLTTRKSLYHCLLTVFTLLASVMFSTVQASEWRSGAIGFDEAKRLAAVSGRPVILYFRTDWCGYCKKFESETLADQSVKATMSNAIKVRVNPESDSTSKALAKRFAVKGYPHFLVLLSDGSSNRLHPFKGKTQQDAAKFNEKLAHLLNNS